MPKSDIQTKQDIFVSVIVSSKGNVQSLSEYVRNLSQYLISRYTNYEVIIVDNNLNAEEIMPVVSTLDELPCLRIIRLSRNYTHDTAIMAGIEAAIGDYVVIADPNIDNIDNIEILITTNKKIDIVQGVADVEDGKMLDSSLGRRIFYWYNRKYLGIDVPVQATYFIALSRRAVRAVSAAARQDVYIRHIIKTIGYSYATLPYKTKEDPARSTSFRTGLVEALGIISSHSTHPLRVMSWVGFFASVLNLAYVLYILGVTLFKGHVAEGWTTMSLQLSAMFFILFIFMIVLSEYIGKILSETRRDSRYLVMDELTSTVSLADAERKNVSKD
jgi:glycosyltransferase involved in cell wall biosynthesis